MQGKKMLAHPIIHLLVDENPKRLGTLSYTRFAQYEDGITVGEFLDRGGTNGDLKWDEKHKFIRIVRFKYHSTASTSG